MVAVQAGMQEKNELSSIKSKLMRRVAFALLMILALLGGLALFDYFTARVDNVAEPPRFTERVPVGKKIVTQPLTPAEPPVLPAVDVKTPAEPEASAAPVEKSPPPPPEVAAQPALPKTRTAGVHARTPAAHKATLPAAAETTQLPAARPVAAAPVSRKPPNPPKLFSGYALQAGVFSDTHRAEEAYTQLVEAGIPASLETRVQVGPFKSKSEALAAKGKMKALGIEAMMLPRRGKF